MMLAATQIIVISALHAVWLYFIAGALGMFARLAIGTTQKSLSWRSGVEMLVGGVSAVATERLGVLASLPIAGEQFARLDEIGKACVLFGSAYIGGHIFRAMEHRWERRTNGNGHGPVPKS